MPCAILLERRTLSVLNELNGNLAVFFRKKSPFSPILSRMPPTDTHWGKMAEWIEKNPGFSILGKMVFSPPPPSKTDIFDNFFLRRGLFCERPVNTSETNCPMRSIDKAAKHPRKPN